MNRKNGNVLTFRQKVSEVGHHGFEPSAAAVAKFVLPKGVSLMDIKNLATTVDFSLLGVTIPQNAPRKDLFEKGFRHGLMTNRLTDPKLHFRRSFSHGFCWAKYFYRKFNSRHPLAASGSFRGRG